MKKPCAVSGCEWPHEAKGYCSTHYKRWKKHGDPLLGAARTPTATRYTWTYAPEHPIATADGKVLTHRLVLFEKIGDGAHSCYWCGTPVEWKPRSLHVDHLDHDTWNNDPANLVPSCNPCNGQRVQGEEWEPWQAGQPIGRSRHHARCRKKLHLMTPDNVYIRKDTGRRSCKTCAQSRARKNS